jgi:Uma2 family endonuclease
MSAATTQYTADDLLTMPDGERYELVDGELVETNPMGGKAGWTAGEVFGRLREHAKSHGGWAFPDGVSYQCYAEDPNRVRRPDASFVAAGRFPNDEVPDGHIRIAPNLAVEVVSPHDVFSEVELKVEEYLLAGVQAVWVLSPPTRRVWIYPGDGGRPYQLQSTDELTADDVLPGFRCLVAELFPSPTGATNPASTNPAPTDN